MKILVADDMYTNRLQAGITIRSLGYTFDEASHGDDAILKLSQNHYDLILMDIEMPVRNGLETTRYIRENFVGIKANIPIIAITAHNPEDFFENYLDVGFNGLISKPITKEKLLKSISLLVK
jgi:two-component system, response regulator, stage 0 sporulation protein F